MSCGIRGVTVCLQHCPGQWTDVNVLGDLEEDEGCFGGNILERHHTSLVLRICLYASKSNILHSSSKPVVFAVSVCFFHKLAKCLAHTFSFPFLFLT